MAWMGAAIAGGASLLGGMISNSSNAKNAQADREFQRENMMNAHQWQVEDMRRAGLNPVLSATGGTGAKASGGTSLGTQTDAISPAVSSAIAARRNSQEMDNMKAAEKLTKQQQDTSREQQLNYFQDTDKKAHESVLLQSQAATEKARLMTELQKAVTEQTLQQYHQAQSSSARAIAGKTTQETRSSKVTADLDEKMRAAERLIQAGEGATSAVRNLLPGLKLNKTFPKK